MNKRIGDVGYTDVELKDMITKMRDVSGRFYPAAAGTGCHAFVEFTGLMNEFIKICEQSLAAEVDFATSNTHSGKSLVVHPYNAQYIVEKLDCIFGPSIHSSKEVEAEFAKLAPGPVNEARAWAEKTVQEIAAARIVTCVYCGHQYPDGTPAAKHAALTEHIQTCPKHPMTGLRQQITSFCDMMAEALGAEPLAPEDHDLDVLAEAILTRFKDDENAVKTQEEKLSKVMNAIKARKKNRK